MKNIINNEFGFDVDIKSKLNNLTFSKNARKNAKAFSSSFALISLAALVACSSSGDGDLGNANGIGTGKTGGTGKKDGTGDNGIIKNNDKPEVEVYDYEWQVVSSDDEKLTQLTSNVQALETLGYVVGEDDSPDSVNTRLLAVNRPNGETLAQNGVNVISFELEEGKFVKLHDDIAENNTLDSAVIAGRDDQLILQKYEDTTPEVAEGEQAPDPTGRLSKHMAYTEIANLFDFVADSENGTNTEAKTFTFFVTNSGEAEIFRYYFPFVADDYEIVETSTPTTGEASYKGDIDYSSDQDIFKVDYGSNVLFDNSTGTNIAVYASVDAVLNTDAEGENPADTLVDLADLKAGYRVPEAIKYLIVKSEDEANYNFNNEAENSYSLINSNSFLIQEEDRPTDLEHYFELDSSLDSATVGKFVFSNYRIGVERSSGFTIAITGDSNWDTDKWVSISRDFNSSTNDNRGDTGTQNWTVPNMYIYANKNTNLNAYLVDYDNKDSDPNIATSFEDYKNDIRDDEYDVKDFVDGVVQDRNANLYFKLGAGEALVLEYHKITRPIIENTDGTSNISGTEEAFEYNVLDGPPTNANFAEPDVIGQLRWNQFLFEDQRPEELTSGGVGLEAFTHDFAIDGM